MGADPNLPWLEQAKQHLYEASPRLPQDLIWAIDAIIRHIEGDAPTHYVKLSDREAGRYSRGPEDG